jgi:hypothetical protein
MANQFRRGPIARITIWAGEDSPVWLGDGGVCVEYRGRTGHPSSYGLLAGRPSSGYPAVLIDPVLKEQLMTSVSIVGDRLIDAMAEPEYEMVIRKSASEMGMCITTALAGEISSSQVLFSQLARVLSVTLKSPGRMPTDDVTWACWDGSQ